MRHTSLLVLAATLLLAACNDPSADETSSTDPSGSESSTSSESTETEGTETSTTGEPEPSGALVLDEILDINAVVATKGMDVDDAGRVYLWNYNQDQLEVYADGTLSVLADMGLVSGSGTDLSVSAAGEVVVSKGGSSTGETLMKWSAMGEPLWGAMGLNFPDALLLGLDHAQVGGEEFLFVADGREAGGRVHRLSPADGSVVETLELGLVPLDVAVDPVGALYVLDAPVSNPAFTGDPVELVKYDAGGSLVAGPVVLKDALYLTRASDGVVYVSSTDFDLPTRRILAYDSELEALAETALPAEYEGFVGGITSTGSGDALRVYITAQGGVGSDPICDVLVYRPEL